MRRPSPEEILEDDSESGSSPIASYLNRWQTTQNLGKLDTDSEFEALTITNWIVDMLALRLPLERDAINNVLQSEFTSIAVHGFIGGEGPWKHRLVFFFQSSASKSSNRKMMSVSREQEQEIVRLVAKERMEKKAKAVFELLDVDASGGIDRDELLRGFPQLDEEGVDRLIEKIAIDAEAKEFSFDDFLRFWVQNHEDERKQQCGPEGTKRLSLANMNRDALRFDGHCVYFLRSGTGRLKCDDFLSLVSCGELFGEAADATSGLLSELFVPIFKKPVTVWPGWGKCKEEEATDMVESVEDLMAKLGKVALDARKGVELERVDHKLLNNKRNSSMSAQDARVLQNHCETVLDVWMKLIDPLVKETVQIVASFTGPGGGGGVDVQGPLEEIEWWKDRLLRLENVYEQVSTPESKHVLQINANAHSKALRKWKGVEARLQDALHQTQDTVALLSVLETKLLPLFAARPRVHEVAHNSTTATGIVQALLQLCLSVRAYQSEAMIHQVLGRVMRRPQNI